MRKVCFTRGLDAIEECFRLKKNNKIKPHSGVRKTGDVQKRNLTYFSKALSMSVLSATFLVSTSSRVNVPSGR